MARDADGDEWDELHGEALGETGYWGRAGSGLIILARDTGRLLLPFRSQEVLEPGTWGTWGGAIDPGQEPLESALREAAAETGHPVSGTDAMLLLVYRDDEAGFSYHTFLVTEDREFEPSLNWESDDAAWFGHGDWPSPLHPGLAALLADPLASGKLAAAVAAVSPKPAPGR